MTWCREERKALAHIAFIVAVTLAYTSAPNSIARRPHTDLEALLAARNAGRQIHCLGRAVTMYGTGQTDIIPGTIQNDVIRTGKGDDSVFAITGRDRVCTGPGDDDILGGPGYDRANGGAGHDRCDAERQRSCEEQRESH